MKFKSFATGCFFLLVSIMATAQKKDVAKTKKSLKNYSGILKLTMDTDSSTKSTLLSNLMEDKTGDMSPYIGAASWMDKDKTLHCNSLLEFDFNLIPVEILKLPSLILRADLVLYPVHVQFAAHDNEKPRILHIRQVADKWEDTAAVWTNQPGVNQRFHITDTIATKDMNMPVTINVTQLVLDNILNKKNNGFMIQYDDNADERFASGQLFASPKNENPDLRPQLILYVEYVNEQEYTRRATSTQPVTNTLNDIYWRQNTRYADINNPQSNLIYNMNLRPGSALMPRTSN